MARGYRSFTDFERDEIRPGNRIGWDPDEMEPRRRNEVDFDVDPYEAAFAPITEDDDDEDEDE